MSSTTRKCTDMTVFPGGRGTPIPSDCQSSDNVDWKWREALERSITAGLSAQCGEVSGAAAASEAGNRTEPPP